MLILDSQSNENDIICPQDDQSKPNKINAYARKMILPQIWPGHIQFGPLIQTNPLTHQALQYIIFTFKEKRVAAA